MRRHLSFAALLLLALPAAAADLPKLEAFGGYSHRRVEKGRLPGGESLGSAGRHGWQASLAWNCKGRLGVLADLGAHYGASKPNSLSFLAGPRFVLLRGESVTPFVYAIAGGIRSNSGIKVFGVSIGESGTDLAGAAGAGVDFRLSGRWALRAQGDFFVVRADGDNDGNPRFSAGVVLRLRETP